MFLKGREKRKHVLFILCVCVCVRAHACVALPVRVQQENMLCCLREAVLYLVHYL